MWKTMIVDDEYDIREGLKSSGIWAANGFTVTGAYANGIEALHAYATDKPDMVVTDITMPGMDGLALAKRIRETDNETVILIISGYNHFEYARSSLRYGVEDYVLKPVDFDEFAKILKKVSKQLEIRRMKNSGFDEEIAKTVLCMDENDCLKKILAHIQTHIRQRLLLAELAEEFHFHPFYLGQLIKSHTGHSFNEYLNLLRIQKAKQLLENSHLKIEDISQLVGYRYKDHFYRKFRELVGDSPNEYRNRIKGVASQ